MCPSPPHWVVGLAWGLLWWHACFLGSLRSLQCGSSGKMVCLTQRQISVLRHRSAHGEAPVNCPKSAGFGQPRTSRQLLQCTLMCSYFVVLSFDLVRSNHHISRFPTMAVSPLGLWQATCAPTTQEPGCAEGCRVGHPGWIPVWSYGAPHSCGC